MAFSRSSSLPELIVDKKVLKAMENWEVDNLEDDEEAQILMEGNPEVFKPQVRVKMAQQYSEMEPVPTQEDLLMEQIYDDDQMSAGVMAETSSSLAEMMVDLIQSQRRWMEAHIASQEKAREYREMKLFLLQSEMKEKEQARNFLESMDSENLTYYQENDEIISFKKSDPFPRARSTPEVPRRQSQYEDRESVAQQPIQPRQYFTGEKRSMGTSQMRAPRLLELSNQDRKPPLPTPRRFQQIPIPAPRKFDKTPIPAPRKFVKTPSPAPRKLKPTTSTVNYLNAISLESPDKPHEVNQQRNVPPQSQGGVNPISFEASGIQATNKENCKQSVLNSLGTIQDIPQNILNLVTCEKLDVVPEVNKSGSSPTNKIEATLDANEKLNKDKLIEFYLSKDKKEPKSTDGLSKTEIKEEANSISRGIDLTLSSSRSHATDVLTGQRAGPDSCSFEGKELLADIGSAAGEENKESEGSLASSLMSHPDNQSEIRPELLKRIQMPIEDILPFKEEKCKTPPIFRCIKEGETMRESFTSQSTTMTQQYGKKRKQPEYWSPDVYGKDAKDQGFVVVEKEDLDMIDNFFSEPSTKSWEIITVEEAKRQKSIYSYYEEDDGDEDEDNALPVLKNQSVLLENNYFINGKVASLGLGGGDGKFRLWLDADLYNGWSNCCSTFNNDDFFKEQPDEQVTQQQSLEDNMVSAANTSIKPGELPIPMDSTEFKQNQPKDLTLASMGSQANPKLYSDKKARHQEFKGSDRVLVLKPPRYSKLEIVWEGKVVKRVGKVNCLVKKLNSSRKPEIYHMNSFKMYRNQVAMVDVFPEKYQESVCPDRSDCTNSVRVIEKDISDC